MLIEITEIRDPVLAVYRDFSDKQLYHIHEPDPGIFIAESPMVIGRALDAGCLPVSAVMEKGSGCREAALLKDRLGDIPIYTGEGSLLKQLTGFPLVRGMLCAMMRPPLLSIDRVCAGASRLVVLEDVVNPTNLGAIFRSAAALDMDGILLTHGCTDPLYRRAIRVSMATVFQIPWAFIGEETDWQAVLHQKGFQTAAMALRRETVSIDDPSLRSIERLAVVLGTEGEGLKDSTISACDFTIKIPMGHGVDSLNVAAASAVAFWELGKRSR